MTRAILFLFFFLVNYSVYSAIIINNGLSHEYQVNNNEVVKGTIEMENSGSQSQEVKIYLQDLSYNSKGETFYTDPQDNNHRSNAGWIKLETNILTLKPGEKRSVFYEISVPRTGISEGSYWSIIMVEPTKILESKQPNTGFTIRSVTRYAIQIVTNNKSETLKPDLKFERVKLDSLNGVRRLRVAIANIGDLYVKAIASVEFYDQQTGEKMARYSSIPMGLLPDNDKMFTIDISKMKPGKFSAVLLVTDDADNAFAKNIVLEIKND